MQQNKCRQKYRLLYIFIRNRPAVHPPLRPIANSEVANTSRRAFCPRSLPPYPFFPPRKPPLPLDRNSLSQRNRFLLQRNKSCHCCATYVPQTWHNSVTNVTQSSHSCDTTYFSAIIIYFFARRNYNSATQRSDCAERLDCSSALCHGAKLFFL